VEFFAFKVEHSDPLNRIITAMKMILGIVSVVIVGYLAWRWFAPTTVAPTRAQRSSRKPATDHPPPPKRLAQQPAAKPTPARPVTPQRRLAPEGTYFLVERASLRIDSGVIGFAPGTKVTLVDQAESASTVTDGQYQFTVPSSRLTNDLDIAENVSKSDYAAQAQLADLTAKRVQEYNQQQRDAFIASEKEKAQKKPRPRATPRAPNR